MTVNLSKLEKKLEEVQKRRRERLFSIQDVENILNELETKRMQVLQNKLNRKYLKNISTTVKHAVPLSYRWRAETTVIKATISKSGSVKINIYTEKAPHQAYGGLIEKFQEIYE